MVLNVIISSRGLMFELRHKSSPIVIICHRVMTPTNTIEIKPLCQQRFISSVGARCNIIMQVLLWWFYFESEAEIEKTRQVEKG